MSNFKRGVVSILTVASVCVVVPILLLTPAPAPAPAPVECDHRTPETYFLDDDGRWKCMVCGRVWPTGC